MKHQLIGLTLMINTLVVIGLTAGISRSYKNSTYLSQGVTSILANSLQTYVSVGTNLYPSNQ
jgi:hypothetical protein